MILTIAGYGFVGKAHANVLRRCYELNIVDPKINNLRVSDCTQDGVIICVATPQHDTGACNINAVYEVINSVNSDTPILIKSTVSLEGWLFLKEQFPNHKLTFSPEFLRAANAENDLINLKELYLADGDVEFWTNIFTKAFKDITIKQYPAQELIIAKYFRNAFLATKVSFFNQVYDLCRAFNLDHQTVIDAVTADARIGISHSEVTSARGWGGHCFPKDIAALLHTAELEGVDLSIISEAVNYNNEIRK